MSLRERYTRDGFLFPLPALSAEDVVAGSHRARLAYTETSVVQNLQKQRETGAGPVDEAAVVEVALRPGEMSLHHLDLIHGSAANRSAAAGTGFIVRFVRISGEGT